MKGGAEVTRSRPGIANTFLLIGLFKVWWSYFDSLVHYALDDDDADIFCLY